MAFILPFESEIEALDRELAALDADDPARGGILQRLEALERQVYPRLNAHETFLLSGHPQRPKALDYIAHIFHDVRLFSNPEVRGDDLMVAGEAKLEIDGRDIDVIVIGQQTGPSSRREDLLKLPVDEYRRWNQGMGFPDSYRKAVYFMERAERRRWPVVVFVDTPGADPSQYSEEEGQAFAINEVIQKTTSLKVPNLSYIISLGASGGAIAITPTNRTIINEYATYMVISPGGCASILFRNRSPESIRQAAEGLRLTSSDAVRQGTVDEVVREGMHPGHRYPQELLAAGRAAVVRQVAELLELDHGQAERLRREKFYAMGVWDTSGDQRQADELAALAARQEDQFADLCSALAEFLAANTTLAAANQATGTAEEHVVTQAEGRLKVAEMIYAVRYGDTQYLSDTLGRDADSLTPAQWVQLHEFVLERRYGHIEGASSLHPNGGVAAYQRLHPVDWIRLLADRLTFREFEQTIGYCSVDQLEFPQYQQALARGIRDTGLSSGLITGIAKIGGHRSVLAINNFGLVGSSLCDEIGEKFRYAAHEALRERVPLVSVAMGGGARMQEGTPSMHRNIPKAQHALNELEENGVPHISVIADPTLGGTAISYGLRGDYMIVVEGSANIGFSGRRVVEQFQQRPVSDDFQQGTWLLHRGFVDEVVATADLPSRLAESLQFSAEGGKLTDRRRRTPRRWEPKKEARLDPPAQATGLRSPVVNEA